MALLCVALAVGCGDEADVARVGATSITRADVALQLRLHPSAPEKALDSLVQRALFAEGARRAELEETPEVAARLAQAHREILANALLDRATAEAVSEKALRARYEKDRETLAVKQVHVAQIVVRLAPAATDPEKLAARARINALYARIRSGEAFAEIAREASEDPISAARGGDLGVIREGQTDPRFFAQVASLEKDQLSEPFQSRFGWHLTLALEDPKTVVPEFDQVRGRLAAEARGEAQEALRKKLTAEITVKRHPERLAPMADGGSR
jgi:parvulin-like peptidyl-prolyl isomerase